MAKHKGAARVQKPVEMPPKPAEDAARSDEAKKRQRDSDSSGDESSKKKEKTEEGAVPGTPSGVEGMDQQEASGDVIVYMTGKTANLTRLHADTIEKGIIEKFGEVKKIEQAGRSLRVFCLSSEQKEKMLQGGTVAGAEVDVTEPRRREEKPQRKKAIKKVICGVPIEYTIAELEAASGAAAAVRIRKRVQGAEVSTTTVILHYNEDTVVPVKIWLKFLVFRVRDYIPSPVMCFKCLKYGHLQYFCRQQQQTCSACAGTHAFRDCPNKETPKCANCGGAHNAASRECPKYSEVKDVLQLATKEKISYRDALMKVKAKGAPAPTEARPSEPATRAAPANPRPPANLARRPQMKDADTQTEPSSTPCRPAEVQTEIINADTVLGYKQAYVFLGSIIQILNKKKENAETTKMMINTAIRYLDIRATDKEMEIFKTLPALHLSQ